MFDSIKTRRLSDEIVRQIKEAMFTGKLQAGDKLPTERELAERFETSRASVREALRTLEPEGLIRIKKGVVGGIFIADVDHRPAAKSFQTLLQLRKVSIQQIAEVRLMFEPQVARLAAERATPDDLRQLEEEIDKMSAAVKDKELPRFYDLKFHLLIARAARNPILEVLAESMLGVASKTISELHPSRDTLRHVLSRHRKVFDAVQRRDSDAAFEAMQEHILDVETRLAKQAGKSSTESSRTKTI
jgi:GntR family transcriptional regulator, transcriptional repressor for pyruvate dehydrogenase complex